MTPLPNGRRSRDEAHGSQPPRKIPRNTHQQEAVSSGSGPNEDNTIIMEQTDGIKEKDKIALRDWDTTKELARKTLHEAFDKKEWDCF